MTTKTRLLGATFFLPAAWSWGGQLTIYAPAIILSTVFGWRLDLTIIFSGLVVVIYTALGGSEAVNLTQKYQMAVIFGGMATAFVLLIMKLPAAVSFPDALRVAGGFNKLHALDFSPNLHHRYTVWSGLLGGLFLQLSYFGADQSQVQRYLSGTSLRESRMGLMFNAVLKIPMQFMILLLGAMIFVFYQFEPPPVVFNQAAWQAELQQDSSGRLKTVETEFNAVQAQKGKQILQWLDARHSGNQTAEADARAQAVAAEKQGEALHAEALNGARSHSKANDSDYVFITFILHHLPHGLIGLLVAAFFGAALSSKAAELNALSSTTTVDLYRHLVKRDESDAHYVTASKWFTIMWGLMAIGVALYANLAENLIQAVNILGSIFYGVVLALFLVAFFVKWVGGHAIFWSALVAQTIVCVLYYYYKDQVSYLWLTPIGCAICVLLSMALQMVLGPERQTTNLETAA